MKQKLLFVITQFYKGGAETALLNLMRALSPEAFEVDFLVLNNQKIHSGTCLLPLVPGWVRVVDFTASEAKLPFIPRMWRPNSRRQLQKAARLLGGKTYDWAFQIGEWSSPRFVAQCVNARHKAAWVHNDLDRAEYFDGEEYFRYNDAFDCYLFVSESSMEGSAGAWPVLRGKSRVVHNVLDAQELAKLAAAPLPPGEEDWFAKGLPVLLTCANVRAQKNHLRQLRVMDILQKRGVEFIWLNAGALLDRPVVAAMKQEIAARKLEDRFVLLGQRENPYAYMRGAAAVTVLSDYESWSMVITEALELECPVLATKTSGALHQIVDEQNGLLLDFEAEAIADGIQRFLADEGLANAMRAYLKENKPGQKGLAEFLALVQG